MRKLTTQKAFEAWLAKTKERFYDGKWNCDCCPLAKYTKTAVGSIFYDEDSNLMIPNWAKRLVTLFDNHRPSNGKQALELLHGPKRKGP